jgi:hypothetical protein
MQSLQIRLLCYWYNYYPQSQKYLQRLSWKKSGRWRRGCAGVWTRVAAKSEASASDKDASGNGEEPKKKPEEKLAEALRDAQVQFLKEQDLVRQLKPPKGNAFLDLNKEVASYDEELNFYSDLRQKLMKEFPDHLPLLLENLKRLKSLEERNKDIIFTSTLLVCPRFCYFCTALKAFRSTARPVLRLSSAMFKRLALGLQIPDMLRTRVGGEALMLC